VRLIPPLAFLGFDWLSLAFPRAGSQEKPSCGREKPRTHIGFCWLSKRGLARRSRRSRGRAASGSGLHDVDRCQQARVAGCSAVHSIFPRPRKTPAFPGIPAIPGLLTPPRPGISGLVARQTTGISGLSQRGVSSVPQVRTGARSRTVCRSLTSPIHLSKQRRAPSRSPAACPSRAVERG